MFISIICPIYNEEKYISQCIDSMLAQDIDKSIIELLFIDGMSKDNTRKIVSEYCSKYKFIHLLDNPDRIVPPALNIGIRVSKGDYIIRIDAHCTYPHNYVSRLVGMAQKLDCDNIGAVCRTLPANESVKAQAIATAMSHKFGVGGSSFRVGTFEIKEVDTVPFGCFKREIFNKVGFFDEELIRNQDDEFNGRIIKHGGKIYLLPDLVVDYFARDSFKKLFKMFYQYGLFKPLVNKKLGSPATLRQFFPLLFVLGLILGAAIFWIHPILAAIYFSIIGLYLLLDLYFSIRSSHGIPNMLSLFWSFFIMHISYGWGYIVGIYKIIFGKPFVAKSNH